MPRTINLGQGARLRLFDRELVVQVSGANLLGVEAVAFAVEGKIKDLMADSPRTGRIYTRKGVEVKTSAPGEPPGVDRGLLSGSIKTGVRNTIRGAEAFVISDVVYAPFLELGTSRMAARPVWVLAVRELGSKLGRIYRKNAIPTKTRGVR